MRSNITNRWSFFESRLCAFKGGSSGGGGGSGRVDYPQYIKDAHRWLLDNNLGYGSGGVTGEMVTAADDNPYDIINNPNAEAYDPDADITSMESALNGFDPSVPLPTASDFDTYIDNLISAASSDWDSYFDVSSVETETVDWYEAQNAREVARNIGRLDAMLAGAGAVRTSTLARERAILLRGLTENVGRFRADIHQKRDSERVSAILQMADWKTRLINMVYDAQREKARMTIEMKRIKIVAKSEEQAQNLEIDVRDSLWRVELYQHGANVLAAHSGGTVTTERKQSKTATAIGGALIAASLLGAFGGTNPFGSLFGGGGSGASQGGVSYGAALPSASVASGVAGIRGGQSTYGAIGSLIGTVMAPTLGPLAPLAPIGGELIGNAIGSFL